MTVHDLVEKYIAIRDQRTALKAEFDLADTGLKSMQGKIEAKLMELFDKTGTDSLAVKGVGIAFKTKRTSSSVADKESFMSFVTEHNEWPLLEVRASKTAVEQYMDAHGGELPPGVNYREEVVVNIRRS